MVIYSTVNFIDRPDGTSSKMSVSGAGSMRFISQADQISHMLSTTRQCCNLDVWALAQSHGDGYCSLVTPKRVLESIMKIWF